MTGLQDLINNNYKINLIDLYLNENKTNKLDFFGDWVNNVKDLQEKFIKADPFEHIIIPNFLNENYANILHDCFPEDVEQEHWHKYLNPIEFFN